MPTGADLAAAAHTLVGKPYEFGGKGPDAYDCSGAIFEACRLVGVEFVHGSSAQIAACDPIDVDLAWGTPGALLWREGHDALVYAPDVSVEAVVPAVTLLGRSDTYDGGLIRFTHAGLIPGVNYSGGAVVTITSRYGWRTVFGKRNFHRGMDVRSPLGSEVVALFDGVVEKVTRGRRAGAGVGQSDRGIAAHAPSLSGNAVTVRRADGVRYVEAHVDPAVQVGQRAVARETVLGRTDLSGTITAAHRHIELWANASYASYFDPTEQVLTAAGPRGGSPTPTATPPTVPEEDDMPYSKDELQDIAAEGALQALNGPAGRAIIRELIREQTDPIPANARDAVLGAWLGKGARRATVAQHIAATAVDAEQVVEILTREDPS